MSQGEARLAEFMRRFGIAVKRQARIIFLDNSNKMQVDNNDKASTFETPSVCFLAQAHAHVWLSLLPHQDEAQS